MDYDAINKKYENNQTIFPVSRRVANYATRPSQTTALCFTLTLANNGNASAMPRTAAEHSPAEIAHRLRRVAPDRLVRVAVCRSVSRRQLGACAAPGGAVSAGRPVLQRRDRSQSDLPLDPHETRGKNARRGFLRA